MDNPDFWTTVVTSVAGTLAAGFAGGFGYVRFVKDQSRQREHDCGQLMLDISRDLRAEIEGLNDLKDRLSKNIDTLQREKADLLTENTELRCSLKESQSLVEELQRKIKDLEALVRRLQAIRLDGRFVEENSLPEDGIAG